MREAGRLTRRRAGALAIGLIELGAMNLTIICASTVSNDACGCTRLNHQPRPIGLLLQRKERDMSNLPSSTDKTRTLSTYGLSVREERRAAVAVDASFGAEELVDAGVRAMALPALLAVAAVVEERVANA